MEIGEGYEPVPRVTFKEGVLSVEIDRAPEANYPRVSVSSRLAPPVLAGAAYEMEVEARINLATSGANVLVGLNSPAYPSLAPSYWFQHWHLNSNQIDSPSGNTIVPPGHYYGDWSEQSVSSMAAIDSDYHTFRLAYDGADTLIYSFDGRVVATQIREHSFVIGESGRQVFRVYFERYPSDSDVCARTDCADEVQRLEVRRFAVRVGG